FTTYLPSRASHSPTHSPIRLPPPLLTAPVPDTTLFRSNHSFKAGHRIMVQVQSTWFPLYDRNPQIFVPNIFLAKPGDYVKATQRDQKSTRLNSSHVKISYAVFCLKKKKLKHAA